MNIPKGENRLRVQRLSPLWLQAHGHELASGALAQIVEKPEDIVLILTENLTPEPDVSGELQQRVVKGFDNLID